MKKGLILSRFFLVFFVQLFSNYLPAQVVFNDPDNNMEIGDQIYLLEDKQDSFTIDEVAKSAEFKKSTKLVPNFGITSSSVWIRISIENKTLFENLILQLNQPIVDEVYFYKINSATNHYDVTKMGEYQAFKLRKYLTPEYLFDLTIPTGTMQTYFLKIRCKENMQIPMVLGTPKALYNRSLIKNVASGIYMGIMLVMILYNLFIFGIFRDRSYIFYALYILLTMLTQTSLQGFPFQFLWPNIPWLAIYSPFLFPTFVGIAGLEFLKEFLRLKERSPGAYKFSFVFLIPYAVSLILGFVGYYGMSFEVMEINASAVSIFMLSSAYIVYKKGYQEARFFLVGWSMFLIGVLIYVLKDFEVLPYNNFTRYTMHFGSGVEVILLSFALADRINILKKEKEKSQAEALKISKENENLIKEQNIVLERTVNERTYELKQTNKDLSVTLNHLKDTQAQLVNAEKMASLGQLTAGIAHEINNPINFVSANVKPLQMDIADIFEVIKKYETITPGNGLEDKLREIDSFKKQIDLDFVKTEIDSLLAGIENGASRTAEIVKGLKNFSRLDESDIKEADINEGLKSTLVLLRSAIPNTIEIVYNPGVIPVIECYPGKLNQVFMNVLTNAIQAMVQKNTEEKQKLTISSYLSGEMVCVKIDDTGVGMTPEVKSKVFEPFFTTKDVGSGVGLGMSIVFTIIESHNGKIDIESEPGKGSTVLISLPLKLTKQN